MFPFIFLSARFFLILSLAVGPLGAAQAAIKKTSLDLPKKVSDYELIRISLLSHIAEIKIETPSPYRVLDADGRALFRGEKITATKIRPLIAGLQMGSQTLGHSTVVIQSDGEGIKLDNRLYRHAVKILREPNGTLSVVNEVPIEDYLRGVLPLEVNVKWPIEALKAQAVASRTFALFKAIENQKERTVLTKGVLSQVYGGKTAEHPVSDQAVAITEGEILVYKGKIFPAYFHSTCSGATTRAEYVWDVEPNPVLSGVKCSFCRISKHSDWEARLTPQQVEKNLRKGGFRLTGIRRIAAGGIDETGRAKNFQVEHAKGKIKIHSNDFRLWMDPAKIKSTLVQSITFDGQEFIFKGRGWGHGVGLCQYGMKQLAELGYTYKQILEYYYPGSEIITLGRTGLVSETSEPVKPEEREGGFLSYLSDLF